jgi:PTH1 family peptidyl-tRNA hydrolase
MEGRRVALVKPMTFMNLSGLAVSPLFRKRAEEAEDLVVVHDDLDLPVGAVRLKRGGGTGGHNGLKSLGAELGTLGFLRIRVGIGRPPAGVDPADYVLTPPAPLRGTRSRRRSPGRRKPRETSPGSFRQGHDALET